ncbi:hypothetical protein TELCIR_12512, partial [Teladorsagia circumcincta]
IFLKAQEDSLLECGKSFTYIRIIAIVQFVFFIVPFPLKILTEHYQRGQTWIATNFLPVVIGLFHFAISSLCLCVAFRLQLLLNYVRRSRRWNSLAWVAWRKICWILPFGVIVNVSLCFEYNLDYDFCVIGNRPHAIGRARLSETARQDHIKMEVGGILLYMFHRFRTLQSLQAVLKEDAIYRVRFAMPQSVGVIEEEDESGEQRDDEATVAHAFMESAQFLERPIFVEDDSNSGYSEHML